MAYTVLARRYRSQKFDDVIGQTAIARTLKNAIKTDRVAHAYLFSGTRGVGKTTMARILAKSLNCLTAEGPTTEPCLKCDSCVCVNSGEDIDVIEIDGASNRGIENIRELRQNAIYRPARARNKIYIIDEVHMLTTEAFNALLKILEEPPEHVKFIFATTEPNKVLATIQSRTQRFDFTNISVVDISEQLKNILKKEKVKSEPDLILALARYANGSMRDALSLLDQLISTGADPLTAELLEELLGRPSRDSIYDLIEKVAESDAAAVLAAIDNLLNEGLSAVQFVDSVLEVIRDLMIIKTAEAGTELVVLTKAARKRLTEIAQKFDISAIVYNVTVLEKLRWSIKNSENPRTLLEASMLRLTLSEHFTNVTQLLSQLKSGGAVSVKKKLTVSNPPTSSAPQPQTPLSDPSPSKPPVLDGQLSIDKIRDSWLDILAYVKARDTDRVAHLLQKFAPKQLRGSVLVLTYPATEAFTKNLCETNGRTEKIQSLLSDAIGEKINIAFELDNSEQLQKKNTRPPGAKMGKEQMDEAASTPAVKAVLLGLDANIIDVKETEQS